MADRPNPGSPEAQKLGCTCPVLDNGHGRGIMLNDGVAFYFYMDSNCPLHGVEDAKLKAKGYEI